MTLREEMIFSQSYELQMEKLDKANEKGLFSGVKILKLRILITFRTKDPRVAQLCNFVAAIQNSAYQKTESYLRKIIWIRRSRSLSSKRSTSSRDFFVSYSKHEG